MTLYRRLPLVPFAWITWWVLQIALRARLGRRDPWSLAPRLRQSLLAIHGGRDRRIPEAEGDRYYRRWAGPKTRWIDPVIGHVRMYARHPEEYSRRVVAFFDEALA